MKKAKNNIEIEKFADRIKQSLAATYVPTYDWMYELGLGASQRDVYAYIFNVCKQDPMAEHCINSQEIADVFSVTRASIIGTINDLVNLKLINKRIEGKGPLQKTYYSLYQPA